jgi:hypothetical protein
MSEPQTHPAPLGDTPHPNKRKKILHFNKYLSYQFYFLQDLTIEDHTFHLGEEHLVFYLNYLFDLNCQFLVKDHHASKKSKYFVIIY